MPKPALTVGQMNRWQKLKAKCPPTSIGKHSLLRSFGQCRFVHLPLQYLAGTLTNLASDSMSAPQSFLNEEKKHEEMNLLQHFKLC